jgi:signal transduction histidine kinase
VEEARILIVEDEKIIARGLSDVLVHLDYTVVAAVASGEEAIQKAADLHPDLVLMDIVLKGRMDGIEAARQIRDCLDIPSIFLTAYSEDEIVQRAKITEPFGFILKPFQVRELHATIQMALYRQRAERKLKQVEQELRHAQISLEQRVAERTAELADANQRLRHLSVQIINAQEAERKRISQELHDEMGQALTAIIYNLEMSLQDLPPGLGQTTKERLVEAYSLTLRTLEQVRLLSLDLRPAMLDDLGLLPALRSYVGRYTRRTGIEVAFEAIGMEEQLGPEMETALYRIVQEALTNVARHAQARSIRLRLECKASTVAVVVEDDGRGFDVEKTRESKPSDSGVGLLGIEERVHAMGGSLCILSQPGQGTVLSVEMPLLSK